MDPARSTRQLLKFHRVVGIRQSPVDMHAFGFCRPASPCAIDFFFLSFPRRQGSHHISAAAKVCCQSTDKAQNTKLQHTRGSNTMSATQTVDALHGPSHHVLTFSAVPSAARRSGQNAPFIYSLASCDVRDSRCPSSPTCLHPRPW